MIEEFKHKIKLVLPELKEKYGIYEIGVFGSYVRGEQNRDSDLDILISLSYPIKMNLFDFIDLQDELSNLLKIEVDLVDKEGLKPAIGKRVLEEVIYIE